MAMQKQNTPRPPGPYLPLQHPNTIVAIITARLKPGSLAQPIITQNCTVTAVTAAVTTVTVELGRSESRILPHSYASSNSCLSACAPIAIQRTHIIRPTTIAIAIGATQLGEEAEKVVGRPELGSLRSH